MLPPNTTPEDFRPASLDGECIRCAKTVDIKHGDRWIDMAGGKKMGPYCRPCRNRFVGTLTKATRNRAKYRAEYGLLLTEYGKLLAYQRGTCAICHDSRDVSRDHRALAVDHNHNTGEVRGLLCDRCNRGIGMFSDDPALLASAIVYLTTRVPLNLVFSDLDDADETA